MSDAERLALDAEEIQREEAFVLATINHGRRVSSDWPDDPTPRHLVAPPENRFGDYAAAVTAILTAAVVEGYEPDEVYGEALMFMYEWFGGAAALAPR